MSAPRNAAGTQPATSVSSLHARWWRAWDGLAALGWPERRAYRRELLSIIDRAAQQWPGADYGAGYLYQSLPALGLHGFRVTEQRLAQWRLGASLSGLSVLEIGCNTGFLSLSLSSGTARYRALDNNPHLIEIACLTQRTLRTDTVAFEVADFESLAVDETFDVVISFANHSTWDGNLNLPAEAYFAKTRQLLRRDGRLLFESHHPALESPARLALTLRALQQHFTITRQFVHTLGSAWDRGRTLLEARPRVDTARGPGTA